MFTLRRFFNCGRLVGVALALGSIAMGRSERPNVLFIAVDDLNDWAGYAGHDQIITPHMDRLVGGSVWFQRSYVQYPVCGPSRASIMSGMYYDQLGSTKLQAEDDFVAEAAEKKGSALLHNYLKGHGYKTMAVGKILHKHIDEENVDMSGGRGNWDFNYYRMDDPEREASIDWESLKKEKWRDWKKDDDATKERKWKDYRVWKLKKSKIKKRSNWDSDKTITDWGVFENPEDTMSDYKAAEWAVERLGEDHDKPFMLMVGFLRPHAPFYVPKKYFDMYDPDTIKLPPYKADDLDDVPDAAKASINDGYPRTEWAIREGQWKRIVHAYMASITFVDTQVGKVLDALEKSPYRDNTIVVLWSDHGYHMGEKNTFQKHTMWDRSAVAPLIIKVPGLTQGKKSSRVVNHLDIYPTVVDLCGLPANDKVAGRSLSPLLKDPALKWDFPGITHCRGGVSVQYGYHRYIEHADGSQELYDHERDPNEWSNLAGNPEYASVLAKMKKMSDPEFARKRSNPDTSRF